MIDYKLIGNRIKTARRKSDMTQEKLSALLSVTPEHVSRMETGATNIGLEMIDRIAEILLVEPEDLLFGTATTSSHYLSKELNEYLNGCSPKKIEAIVKMAKIISEF